VTDAATDPAPSPAPDRAAARTRAIVEEACKKSAMLWLRPEAAGRDGRSFAAWHVWTDGAAHIVSGGLEQRVPVLDEVADGARLVATVRSKDTGGRLVAWVGVVRRLHPDDAAWETVVPELHAKRLNAPDGEAQPARWARESAVHRIEPTGELLETPGNPTTGSHAAEPPSSPATTRGRLPFVVGRRARRRK
jgi:hypothetical protein